MLSPFGSLGGRGLPPVSPHTERAYVAQAITPTGLKDKKQTALTLQF